LAFALIVCMLQLKRCRNKTSVLLVGLAGSFHSIGLVFGILAFFSRYVSLKMATLFWFLCAATGLFITPDSMFVSWALSFVNSNYLIGYFSSDSLDYKFGLRMDFLFFSFVLLCLGAVLMKVKKGSINRVISRGSICYIYKSYLVLNGFGLLFLQMPYADRWLNWSWALIPFFLLWIYDSIRAAPIKIMIMFFASLAAPIMLLTQLNLM
jgi:hypothetical protein